MKKNRLNIFNKINAERVRQDKKWGEQNHNDEVWHLIASEEFGEISQAVCSARFDNQELGEDFEEEVVQTAAVLVAWLESRNRNKK